MEWEMISMTAAHINIVAYLLYALASTDLKLSTVKSNKLMPTASKITKLAM